MGALEQLGQRPAHGVVHDDSARDRAALAAGAKRAPQDAIDREREVAGLGGRKSLYSTSYYGREEFYEIYGGAAYAGLKEQYDPDGRFPELYDKTCVEVR